MIKVLTYGVFDYLHIGHIRLFRNIRLTVGEPCCLIVAAQKDEYIIRVKPTAKPLYNEDERLEMLESIKVIDKVVLYDLVDTDIKKRNFDILAMGPDQTNVHCTAAKEYAIANNKKVVIIQRTEGISSSQIKSNIKKDCK
jgi:glycerol-3-phosphate cytidylyltransferase